MSATHTTPVRIARSTISLVGDWPKRPGGAINRSLNGNHEMYSGGGKGYFSALGDFFRQPASCFAMQNSKWILVCLDTAYNVFNLDAAQVAWLEALVAAAGTRKLILFSHHQPFSQLDDQGPKLQWALGSLQKSQRSHAWYWGHEHRLVLYETSIRSGASRAAVSATADSPRFATTCRVSADNSISGYTLGRSHSPRKQHCSTVRISGLPSRPRVLVRTATSSCNSTAIR